MKRVIASTAMLVLALWATTDAVDRGPYWATVDAVDRGPYSVYRVRNTPSSRHAVYGLRSPTTSRTASDPQPGAVVTFKYERRVTVTAPGPNRLDVDIPLVASGQPFGTVQREGEAGLAAVGGLGDLRLYDEENREVPYLLVGPPDRRPEWWSTTRLLDIPATRATSGFEADLGRSQLVDRVALAGLAPPFLKRVRLEASGDRARWSVLAPEATVFDLPDERLQELEVGFQGGEFRYFRVTWDDRSSARVGRPLELRARAATPVPAPPPLVADVGFERRTSEPGKTRYRVRLPGPRLPIVALEIDAAGNILRHARVSEPRLTQDRVEPVEIGAGMLRQSVRGGAAAREMRIAVEQPSHAELELTIDNGNNPPLEVTAVRAVFAELPWIYFEAPRAGTLAARIGNERLSPPHYDLEAARAEVAGKTPARAQWGTLALAQPASAPAEPVLAVRAGARIDPGAFRFSREIAGSEPGLTAIRLDAAVLAHARPGPRGGVPGSSRAAGGGPAFADLRVIDPDGIQVPYLVEQLDEPLVVPLPALERGDPPWAREARPSSGSVTIYRVRLPFGGLPASRLLLQTAARVFDRRLTVHDEARGARERRRGIVLGGGRWTHADPETPAPSFVIPLSPSSSEDAWLVVDEGDNSPLPLDQPTLLLPGYRLRFNRLSRSPLRLAYGDEELEPPQYDLSLLASALLGAGATEAAVGPEQAAPARTPPSRFVFWSVLVAAVVVLLFLVARLVASGAERSPGPQG